MKNCASFGIGAIAVDHVYAACERIRAAAGKILYEKCHSMQLDVQNILDSVKD